MPRSVSDEVLGALCDGDIWTGQRLANHLGVSLRTVRRATSALRDDGIAIETDIGPGGGIRLSRRSGLPRLRLGHQEAVSLLVALALAESLRLPLLGAGLQPLRTKLAATFAEHDRRGVALLRKRILIGAPASEAVLASWRTPSPGAPQLLQEAFVACRVVRFRYSSEDDRVAVRCAEPQYLLLNHPAWYLLAFDRDRRAGRTFRVDRIQQVEVLDEVFTRVPADSLSSGLDQWFKPL
jgi:predicted DNA-binding transcriptional regulator YafY